MHNRPFISSIMNTLLTLLIVCSALITNGLPSPQIVGGKNADEAKYPYQVSLRNNGIHFCGGSIINKRFILTAAHCISKRSTKVLKVVAGTNYLNEGGDSYSAVNLIIHSNYSLTTHVNDIGLVQVDRDIKFYKKVQPIPLAFGNYIPSGEGAVVAGWGMLSAIDPPPNELQEIFLTLISQKDCQFWYWYLTELNVCTLTREGEGVCYGDSGSPLVMNGIQIGIVSFGNPCALGFPDVYTKVYPYKGWINSVIKE